MERCLYGAQGYYSSGVVRFGPGAHFWTWPQRLRPAFGVLVAEQVRRMLLRLLATGRVPPRAPLTVLELGPGDGALGADLLSHVARSVETPAWRGVADRLHYVAGEPSPALRARLEHTLQQWIQLGWAEVRALDARELRWEGPLWGVVVANELLDALPCERVKIVSPGDYERVCVVPDGARGGADAAFAEVGVPLPQAWDAHDGEQGQPPAGLARYLRRLAPLVEDLAAHGRLPTHAHWAPGVGELLRSLAELLAGPDRAGMALLIDYGGESRRVLDPGRPGGHLRAYGAQPERAQRGLPDTSPFLAPGLQDLTWDVDFDELVAEAERAGLRCAWRGLQAALEQPLGALRAGALGEGLLRGRVAEGLEPTWRADGAAEALVREFRADRSFHALVLEPPRLTEAAAAAGLGPTAGAAPGGPGAVAGDAAVRLPGAPLPPTAGPR